MSKRFGNKNTNDEEPTKISQRIVQYVDDPKNSSALAKIHEMSNKAKRTGKSPAQFRRSHYIPKIEEPIIEKNEKNEPNKKDPIFQRRSVHYATVKPNMSLLNKNLRKNENVSDKKEFVLKFAVRVTLKFNLSTVSGLLGFCFPLNMWLELNIQVYLLRESHL